MSVIVATPPPKPRPLTQSDLEMFDLRAAQARELFPGFVVRGVSNGTVTISRANYVDSQTITWTLLEAAMEGRVRWAE